MVKASIVRLGPRDGESVSSKLLRTAIVSYFEKHDTNGCNETIDNKSGSTITISNKYFTANVVLEDIEAQDVMEGQTKEDGVILVFDALRSNPDLSSTTGGGASFDSLALAHQRAEENNVCGDLLRLCVAVTLTSLSPEEIRGKDHEKEYARRIMWCLDHGYEYVEADLSEEGQGKGHQDRDKEGFARIIEAIQGTVWSSAVMAKAKTQQLKASYNEDSNALSQPIDKGSNTVQKEAEENPYQPPDPSRFATVESDDNIGGDVSLTSDEGKSNADVLDEILDPEKVGPEEMSKLRQDLEADKVFEKMEGALKEANRIREASMNGAMSDEERRARAGDAAMVLVNLMGDMGFDGDDDDSVVAADDSDDSGIVRE